MPHNVRAALVQTEWTGDTESMLAVHEKHARDAAAQGTRVIGFQEVFNAPYFCQVQEPEHHRWAKPVPDGPPVTRFSALAKELGMVMVLPVFEVEGPGFYAMHDDVDGAIDAYGRHVVPAVS